MWIQLPKTWPRKPSAPLVAHVNNCSCGSMEAGSHVPKTPGPGEAPHCPPAASELSRAASLPRAPASAPPPGGGSLHMPSAPRLHRGCRSSLAGTTLQSFRRGDPGLSNARGNLETAPWGGLRSGETGLRAAASRRRGGCQGPGPGTRGAPHPPPGGPGSRGEWCGQAAAAIRGAAGGRQHLAWKGRVECAPVARRPCPGPALEDVPSENSELLSGAAAALPWRDR